MSFRVTLAVEVLVVAVAVMAYVVVASRLLASFALDLGNGDALINDSPASLVVATVGIV